MKIESIKLKNFKALRNVEIKNIPRFCVIVGANGTGKTTFFDVLGFIKDALTDNVQAALSKRGGFREVRSRNASGTIEIQLKFRFDVRAGDTVKTPLATYTLGINEKAGKAFVEREQLCYRRGSHGSPRKFLEFFNGEGSAASNEFDELGNETHKNIENQKLARPDILAIKGLAQFQRYPAVMALGQLIENWNVSNFHISAAKHIPDAGYAEHLSREGENLALVTQYLYEHHRPVFESILMKLADRVPGIKKVEATQTEEGRVLLRFRDGPFKDPFLARYVSDGTIKMFAYLVLLYDPSPHPLLCVEEPENLLYPKLLWELAEEFRGYSNRGGQVFVSTHSPDFLNAIKLEEVFWLTKEHGYSEFHPAVENEQVKAYMEDGDQMGYLWKEGFFEGADPQ